MITITEKLVKGAETIMSVDYAAANADAIKPIVDMIRTRNNGLGLVEGTQYLIVVK